MDKDVISRFSGKIVIIDYGMGNLQNVANAFRFLGFKTTVSGSRKEIEGASHLVLPGVGGFKDAMETLNRKDMVEPIKSAIKEGKKFLGICLGMQLLFETSEEFGYSEGLGVLKGKVVKFDESTVPLIPHIGWNDITISSSAPELEGIANHSFFYFLHSYYCVPEDNITAAVCDYHGPFTACIKKDNIFACQFHPEKSHNSGLNILMNFIKNK